MTGWQQPSPTDSLALPFRPTFRTRVWPYHVPANVAREALVDALVAGASGLDARAGTAPAKAAAMISPASRPKGVTRTTLGGIACARKGRPVGPSLGLARVRSGRG